MNTYFLKKANYYFRKYSFRLMNYSVFGKTMGNLRKHVDIKVVTTEKKQKLFGVRT